MIPRHIECYATTSLLKIGINRSWQPWTKDGEEEAVFSLVSGSSQAVRQDRRKKQTRSCTARAETQAPFLG